MKRHMFWLDVLEWVGVLLLGMVLFVLGSVTPLALFRCAIYINHSVEVTPPLVLTDGWWVFMVLCGMLVDSFYLFGLVNFVKDRK